MPSTREVGGGEPSYACTVASSSSTALCMLIISCFTIWPVGKMGFGSVRESAVGRRVTKVRRRMAIGVRVSLIKYERCKYHETKP